MNDQPANHKQFVTIAYFMVEMLGFTSRQSYYDHLSEPGWPQRVLPGGRPMLVYAECLAYQQSLLDNRAPPPAPPPKRRKRHTGRPAGKKKIPA